MSPLRLFLFLTMVYLAGCSRDPSLEISGSFFPAWLICILVGVLVSLIAHRIFLAIGVSPYLKPRLLVYGALALSLTLLVWLLFYT
jgi:hypothetical protein